MKTIGMMCVAACVTLSACAGGQKVEENQAPALMNAGEVATRYARWLPGESVMVGVIDLDATLTYFAGSGVEEGDPKRRAKLEARKDALRSDLARLSRERLGMDVTGAKTILVGVGPIMQTVVLLGVTPAAQDAVEVEGMKAFKVAPRHPADIEALGSRPPEGRTPWALTLPGGEGVVLFLNRKSLDALAGSDGMSLAKANTLGEYTSALGHMPSRMGFVAGTGAFAPFMSDFEDEVGFKGPRIVSATVGDRVGVLLRGEPASLEALEDMRLEQHEDLLQQIEPQYAKLGELATPVAAAVVLGYHGTLGLEEALDVRLKGDTLSYSFPTKLFAASAPAGILAAIAIPAFMRATKKSKVSESESNMKKLSDGGKTYFYTEQKIGSQGEPWHVDSTGTMAGYPVAWSDYVFPGGVDFTFTSSDEIPQGGGKVMPRSPDSLSALERAALNKLFVDFNEPTYFRYTITTGPGRGPDATMTITAEADYDPSTPEVHTVTQTLGIDAMTQEVYVSPPFTVNEFE